MTAGRVVAALLAAAAAAWLAFGVHLGLELVDEGHIVYPTWRVAAGDLPYRDFQQLYGPSVFLLNGALLRVFGDDLAVVRASVLVVKLLLGTLVYVLARAVAGRGLALVVTAAFVVVWGTPIWLFNTPYANHYALAVVVLLRDRARPLRAALVAGLLVGAAMTFKQTAGAFAAVVVALFVLAPASDRRDPPWLRALWWAAVAATALVVVAYLRDRTVATAVLTLPLAGLVAVATWRGGDTRDGGVRAQPVTSLVAFAGGAVLPLVAYAAVFAAEGAFERFAADTLLDLPARVAWYVPLPWPNVGDWVGVGAFAAVLWLPLVVPLAALPALAVTHGTTAVWLVAWSAAGSTLAMYPAADMPHALMLLPVVLPLLAWLLATAAGPSGVRRVAVLGVAAVAAGMILRTPVQQTWTALTLPPVAPLPRASGIRVSGRTAADAAGVLALLAREPVDRPVLLLPSEQMLYFLGGRRAALQDREYMLYLATTGFVDPQVARDAFDERGAIAVLAREQPLVVVHEASPYLARVRATFPTLVAFIEKYYRERERVGGYTVLEPVMNPPDPALVPPSPPSPPGALPQ
jgi:hypothetical protein